MPQTQKCKICGCTDGQACEGGCSWVKFDLCSACAEKGTQTHHTHTRGSHSDDFNDVEPCYCDQDKDTQTPQEEFRYFKIPNMPIECAKAFDSNGITFSMQEVNIEELKSLWQKEAREEILNEFSKRLKDYFENTDELNYSRVIEIINSLK
jgi:hypothetical protein